MISTPGVKYLVVDVKRFYLNNAMAKHEYYKIDLSIILQYIINKYNLMENETNSFLYVRLDKGMYGLVQSVIITHLDLREHLQPFGYEPAPITPGLWSHNKNGINFTLVVYNFGIRY